MNNVVDSLYRINEDWSDSAVLTVMHLRENDWPEDFINTLSLALDKMPDSVSNYIYNRVSGHGYSITSSEGKNKAFDFFFDVLCHENGLNQKERDSLLKVLG